MDLQSPNSSVLSEVDFGNTTCDSDKENITPRHTMDKAEFRCQPNLLNNTSLYGINSDSRIISPQDTSPVEINNINSTTSQLNEYINRVNVADDIDCEPNQRERVNSCSDISEISFDLKREQRRFSESMINYDKSINLGSIHEEDDYSHIITPQKPLALSQDIQRRLTETTPESSTTTRDTSKFTPKLSTLKENKILGTPDVTRRHPFDNSMMDNFPIFSPGIFSDINNKSGDTFKWSIEHLSECNPAQFSVDQPSYILEEERKAHEDTEYQSHVKSYFSQSRIAPSPFTGCKSFQPCGGGYSTISCQTNISLPIDFDLEAALEGKTEKKIPVKEPKIMSDTSYRRQLFHTEPLDGTPDQEDLLISPEELQHSPTIKSAPGTPLSDDSPSFLIGDPGFSTSNISVFSPIKDDNVLFRTPKPSNRKQPSDSYNLMSTPAHLSVNSEDRMLQSTPAHLSVDHNTMPAPNNKRKPEDTPEKGRSNFKKYSNSQFLSPIGRGAMGNIRRHKNCPVKKPRIDNEGSPGPRRVTFRLERLSAPRRPLESSRIDSDVSSDGVSPPILVPGIQALDIPLDISEIKHTDLTKLRTNNFLDISDISRKTSPCMSPAQPPVKGEWSIISEDFKKNVNVNETANESNKPTNSVNSKDSGFSSVASGSNTLSNNYTLATHTATLSTLSEKVDLSEVDRDLEKEILLESRPGKRKNYPPEENLSQGSSDDSGFCPPPVKRVLNVAEFGTTPAVKSGNAQALDVSGMAVEINDPGSSP